MLYNCRIEYIKGLDMDSKNYDSDDNKKKQNNQEQSYKGVKDSKKNIKEQDRLISQKFDYIIDKYFGGSLTDIKNAFGFDTLTKISAFKNPNNSSNLKKVHIESLERHFNIPVRVFDFSVTMAEIDGVIEEYRKRTYDQIFSHQNPNLIKNIKGTLYAHSYASFAKGDHAHDGVNIVETTISDDYSVIDQYNNRGILKVGQQQSFIIKESKIYHNLNIIRFNNDQAIFGDFHFVILSSQHRFKTEEMVNFGFFSRQKHTPEQAKKILGDIKKVQLKLDSAFAKRVVEGV